MNTPGWGLSPACRDLIRKLRRDQELRPRCDKWWSVEGVFDAGCTAARADPVGFLLRPHSKLLVLEIAISSQRLQAGNFSKTIKWLGSQHVRVSVAQCFNTYINRRVQASITRTFNRQACSSQPMPLRSSSSMCSQSSSSGDSDRHTYS